MALDVTDEAVDIWTAGTTDNFSMVPSTSQWYIFYDIDGYVFVYDEGGIALTYASAAGEGSPLYCADYVETDATFRWTVTEMPLSQNGIVFFDTNNNELCMTPTFYPELGQTKTLANLGYIPSVYSTASIAQNIAWSSSDTTVATVNSSTGAMTGVSRNDATVSAAVTINAQTYTNQYALAVEETIYVVNLYDSTLTNDATRLGYIDEAVAFLNTVYREEYNLHFIPDGAPQLYLDSTITVCRYGLAAGCSTEVCGDTCLNHHKNLNRIANRLYASFWSENHIVAKWCNHAKGFFCVRDKYTGAHSASQAYAVNTFVNGVPQPIVQVINIDSGANDNIEAFMAVNLAHEVAHSLGLKEVYNGAYNLNDILTHYEYYKNEKNPIPCIMAAVIKDKINALYGKGEDALCDLCRGYLASEIPDDTYTD